MRLSIICCLYRAKPSYVVEQLRSCLSARFDGFSDIEIFIVDDGSPESERLAVRAAIENVISPPVRRDSAHGIGQRPCNWHWIDLPVNIGPASARNVALRRCTGDIISFMDGDDFLLPNRFVEQARFFEQHPDHYACAGQVLHYRDGEVVGASLRPVRHDELKVLSLFTTPFANATLSLNGHLFRARPHLYREGTRMGEDWRFGVELLQAGEKLGAVDEPVLIYRHHATQATAGADHSRNTEINSIFLDQLRLLGLSSAAAEDLLELHYAFTPRHIKTIAQQHWRESLLRYGLIGFERWRLALVEANRQSHWLCQDTLEATLLTFLRYLKLIHHLPKHATTYRLP